MLKYWFVTKNSIAEYLAYRVNFVLWRLRVVISILITFFLWQAIFIGKETIFNYSARSMFTYIILLNFITSIVFSTQTFRVAEEINKGTLSNLLIKPIDYIKFNLFRDFADKLINTCFSLFEIALLLVILKPPFIFQTNPVNLLLFSIALVLSVFLYFYINLILSFIGFWSKETWAPRFIFFIVVSFLAGTYFPLDIVPKTVYSILELLPFTYLIFFPLKIYLSQVHLQFIIKGFTISFIWIIALYYLSKKIWHKGLRVYTAEGK